MNSNLENVSKSQRISKNLPIEKIRSALRILSEVRPGITKKINSEMVSSDLDSKLKSVKKISTQIDTRSASTDFDFEPEPELIKKSSEQIDSEITSIDLGSKLKNTNEISNQIDTEIASINFDFKPKHIKKSSEKTDTEIPSINLDSKVENNNKIPRHIDSEIPTTDLDFKLGNIKQISRHMDSEITSTDLDFKLENNKKISNQIDYEITSPDLDSKLEKNKNISKQIDAGMTSTDFDSKLENIKKISKQIDSGMAKTDLDSKFGIINKISRGHKNISLEQDTRHNRYETFEQSKMNPLEEYDYDEVSGGNVPKIGQINSAAQKYQEIRKKRLKIPEDADIEELSEVDENLDIEDEIFDGLEGTRKGICVEIAENPDMVCRRDICRPTPHREGEKSKIENQQMYKKICRRQNETGMMSCVDRYPAIRERKCSTDTSRCNTVIETTVFEPAKTAVAAEDTAAIDSTKNKPLGIEAIMGGGIKQECAAFNVSVAERDNQFLEGNAPTEGQRKMQSGGLCECCNCTICKCEPKQLEKLLVEELDIQVKKVKDLQHGRATAKLSTKYSWDTLDIPNPWNFTKDQEEARKDEKEKLIARAEKLEKERQQTLASLDIKERDDEKMEEEFIEKSETERDWDSYKSIEWAGLRHEYTENVKSVELEDLDALSSVSWTSQPPPQLLLGTVESRKTRVVANPPVVDLGPIEERTQSFVKMGSRGVKVKVEESHAVSENQIERKRRHLLESKRIQQHERDKIASARREQQREFYGSHTPVQLKDEHREGFKNNIIAEEINENMLPIGLRREVDRLRKSQYGPVESTLPRTISNIAKSLPSHDAARLIDLQSFDDLGSARSCSCLPGSCTCGSKHWVFQKSNSTPDLCDIVPQKVMDDNISRTDSELIEAVIYPWKKDECPCPHSSDETGSSPVTSEEFVEQSRPSPRKTEEYTCSCKRRYEQTVVIIRPDAMVFEDVIRRALVYVGGLHIVNERRVSLSPEQVSELYADKHYGSESFPLFVLKMSRLPILVLSVAGLQVMDVINCMIGNDKFIPDSWFLPESIKRRIMVPEDLIEALHISEDVEQSSIESRYFFPRMLIEPVPTMPSRITDFCQRYLDPVLSKGLATVARTKPVDPIIFLAEWLLTHNPFQPWFKPQQINMVRI